MTPQPLPRPLRLAALAGERGGLDRLCVLDGDQARPVGTARDVADLLAQHPGVTSLAQAVEEAGLGEPIGGEAVAAAIAAVAAGAGAARSGGDAGSAAAVDGATGAARVGGETGSAAAADGGAGVARVGDEPGSAAAADGGAGVARGGDGAGSAPALAAPVRPAEVWAAGVTYELSRDARMRESAATADVYQRVYDAERPELFLKATAPRVVGPGAPIGLRGDSTWQVPEPELGLVVGDGGEILGYTLGNDVSSRDIEGENPLYLPQAKIFAGSCALGPVVVAAEGIDPYALELRVRIVRDGTVAWSARTSTERFHTRLERLVEYLRRDNWLPPGTVLLTGTGIVPPDDFTLRPDDVVEIECDELGLLSNRCAPAGSLPAPAGWSAAPITLV